MEEQERAIRRARWAAPFRLIIGGVGLCLCLTVVRGESSPIHSQPFFIKEAKATSAGHVQKNAAMRQRVRDMMVSLLTQKIERINARLVSTRDPKKKARLLTMREQLRQRIANAGRLTDRMLSSNAPAKSSPTPPPAPASIPGGTAR